MASYTVKHVNKMISLAVGLLEFGVSIINTVKWSVIFRPI